MRTSQMVARNIAHTALRARGMALHNAAHVLRERAKELEAQAARDINGAGAMCSGPAAAELRKQAAVIEGML